MPKSVWERIEELCAMAGTSPQAAAVASGAGWTAMRNLKRGLAKETGSYKLYLFCKHIGCTVEDIYSERPIEPIHVVQVSENLAIAFEGHNKNPDEIAEEFGVSVPALGYGFGGRGYPDIEFLTRFCDAYGVSMDWVFRRVPTGVPMAWLKRVDSEKAASQEASLAEGRRAHENSS